MPRVGWLDCSSGVSGDMLLAALHQLGVLDDLPAMTESLSAAVGSNVSVGFDEVRRCGLRAVAATVNAGTDQPHRRLDEIRRIVDQLTVPTQVRRRSAAVFQRLADAEARCHGCTPDEVEFHEVGAIDSLVDVVGACLGLHTLGLTELVVGEISLGGGTARSGHGDVPVPTPAALELLAGTGLIASAGGEVELATPTGIAVLAEWATDAGRLPPVQVRSVGVGAGERDLSQRPNVLRLVIGSAAPSADTEDWITVEANVDDLDPRLWPGVLHQLMAAGAADAWLTPILMKKGRPAHIVGALLPADRTEAVHAVLFAETSTIGARTTSVTKRALDRSWLTVDIGGQSVRVKLATSNGRVLNAVPEFEDVATAAATLGVPSKDILARASAAALDQLSESAGR